MLRDLRGWPTRAPILGAAAALDFGVVTYMIVRRLHPPPPGSRAPPQVTRRMAAAVLGVALLLAAVLGVLLVVIPGSGRIIQLRIVARPHKRLHTKTPTAAPTLPATHSP